MYTLRAVLFSFGHPVIIDFKPAIGTSDHLYLSICSRFSLLGLVAIIPPRSRRCARGITGVVHQQSAALNQEHGRRPGLLIGARRATAAR